MSPGGFPGVTPSTPYGVDTDGAPLVAEPPSLESLRSAVQAVTVGEPVDPDDQYQLREIIVKLLQRDTLGLTQDQAETFVEALREVP
jgi:hypothetical protein